MHITERHEHLNDTNVLNEEGNDFETAKNIILQDPTLRIQKDENGQFYCFRVEDSLPTRSTGLYEHLLKKLEYITGRTRQSGDDDDTDPPWLHGFDADCKYTFSDDTYYGCICNQNPGKGGLVTRYGVRDRKSNIIFLCGRCCARRLLRLDHNDLDISFHAFNGTNDDNRLSNLSNL